LNVIVDTSVWSFGLRRADGGLSPEQQATVEELRELIGEGRVRLLGFIRQEILSGIKASVQFEKLRTTLRSFPDVPLETTDYEVAAKSSNICKSRGVTTSVVDALIATVAIERGWSVFTLDTDFDRLSRILPLKLHTVRR
jgi:predicted nucleic acid-binding protein